MVVLTSWCYKCSSSPKNRNCRLQAGPPHLGEGELQAAGWPSPPWWRGTAGWSHHTLVKGIWTWELYFHFSNLFKFNSVFSMACLSFSASLFMFLCMSLPLLSLYLPLSGSVSYSLLYLSLWKCFLLFCSLYFKSRWDTRRGEDEEQRRRVLDRRRLLWTNDSWETSGDKILGYQQVTNK